MAHEKDFVTLDLTPSATDLLTFLREQFQFISDHVTPSLTPRIFEEIARRVDRSLFTDVSGLYRLNTNLPFTQKP